MDWIVPVTCKLSLFLPDRIEGKVSMEKIGGRKTKSGVEEAGDSKPDGPRAGMALLVFLGGALGTWIRWILSDLPVSNNGFHQGTFLANMLACACYAFLSSYLAERMDLSRRQRDYMGKALGMGLCGGLSTMSTLVVEVLQDMLEGHISGSLIYLLGSFFLGLVLSFITAGIGKTLAGHHRGPAHPGGTPTDAPNQNLRGDA